MRYRRPLTGSLLMILGTAAAAQADEGMWLLNHLPRQTLQKKYGFEPTDEWIARVQKASLKFGSSGSASFVSGSGLLMTNHHVGAGAIKRISDQTHDYIRDGFYARHSSDEIPCPGLVLSQLLSIEDVSSRVQAAAAESDAATAATRRRAEIAAIEQAHQGAGRRAEVVALYHGARYHLYVYKEYDDVRLVMAPESAVAYFGGDTDNFEYPRHCFDVCFFRAYEDGRAAATPEHFTWSAAGPSRDELVFMAGNPARTRRMFTVDHLDFLRDVELPLILQVYNQREVALQQFVQRDGDQRRIGNEALLYTQNGRKAYGGILNGLLDQRIAERKRTRERELRLFAAGPTPPQPGQPLDDAWQDLGGALRRLRGYYTTYFLLENPRSSAGTLYAHAYRLVRFASQQQQPEPERLRGFRDADRQELERALFSPEPTYDSLEQVLLTDALTRFARLLGGEHPVVSRSLAGLPPDVRAAQLIGGTKLKDPAFRRTLYDGGLEAVTSSGDPLIEVALALEPVGLQLQQRYRDEFESIQTEAYARIAQAAFDKDGDRMYPDATFTLRLSIGTVSDFEDLGQFVPEYTHLINTFTLAEQHGNQAPFQLPQRWLDHADALNPRTRYNFISTNDIIGGNSGSPTFNRNCEIVGIVFDGNRHSLVWDIDYDHRRGRSISVHSQAILEILRKIYQAHALADELLGKN